MLCLGPAVLYLEAILTLEQIAFLNSIVMPDATLDDMSSDEEDEEANGEAGGDEGEEDDQSAEEEDQEE